MSQYCVSRDRYVIIVIVYFSLQGFASFCQTIDECWDHDPDARLSSGCIHDRTRALQDATKMCNDPNKWSTSASLQLARNADDVITRLPHNIALPPRHPYPASSSNWSSSSYSGNSSGSGGTTMTSSSGGSDASSRYGGTGAFIGAFSLDEEKQSTCVRPLANVTAPVDCASAADASYVTPNPRRT